MEYDIRGRTVREKNTFGQPGGARRIAYKKHVVGCNVGQDRWCCYGAQQLLLVMVQAMGFAKTYKCDVEGF